MGNRMNTMIILTLEQEKFGLRTDVIRPAAFGNFSHQSLQHPARISFKRLAIRYEDIAEDARPASPHRRPGKDCIGIRVEPQMHIAFLYARKPSDRRTIKQNSIFERAIQSAEWH